MTITPLHTIIHFKTKHTLVKGIIYLKLLEKGMCLPDNDLNVLSLFGLYSNKEEVIKEGVVRNFYKSEQTVDNSISKLVTLKLLIKEKEKIRKIDPKLFASDTSEIIAMTCKIHNINAEL